MENIYEREWQVLKYIIEYRQKNNNVSPSLSELFEALNQILPKRQNGNKLRSALVGHFQVVRSIDYLQAAGLLLPEEKKGCLTITRMQRNLIPIVQGERYYQDRIQAEKG